MAEIRLPLPIIYQTEGRTPVADVIVALQAADWIANDAVSLLPSLIDGLKIEQSSLNVLSLTQESPLREYFLLALVVAFQGDLKEEVPPLLEDIFKVGVSDKYDSLVTVIFMIVVFYGAGMAIDAVKKAMTDSLPKSKFEELVQILAVETGRSAADIRSIIEAKFAKPAAVRRLLSETKKLFLPSQKDKNAPVLFDRDTIGSDMVRQIPYPGDSDEIPDFNRYKPYSTVELELHAQDRDRSATGWAAIAPAITSERLKVKVMEPVTPSDLWQKDRVIADIVVVEKLTANGYQPTEIQITSVIDPVGLSSGQLPTSTATETQPKTPPY